VTFRIVGGTDHTPEKSLAQPRRGLSVSGRANPPAPDDQPSAETLTIIRRNKRLREERYDVWIKASATTHYWLARLELQFAISVAQSNGVSDALRHPPTTQDDRWCLLGNYRKAEASQLLTPAPKVSLVNWKQQVFAKGNYKFTDVRKEQIEKAIAEDLAFLAAHPTRRCSRKNS
jgi:hypothetical protein